jgi:signal transduction histidine kinase
MPAPHSATIFIVDDDQALRRLLQQTLKREGFSTVTASSGEEAIAWLGQNTADLMLLDLKLPDFEGKDLINRVAAMDRSIPFVIITSQGDERVAVDMMKRGALDYLVKDVQFIEFVPTVVCHALEKLQTDKRLRTAQLALEESKTQLLVVSEREQRHFGAELHDGLGQQLTAIELRCQSLKQDLPPSRPDLEKEVAQICQFLRNAISQTRSLAHGLAPLSLDSRGLTDALNSLALRMSSRHGIQCSFDSPSPIALDNELVTGHLFRIAQEAVNNAVKHSLATEVMIRLIRSSGKLQLEVSDNGKGFPKTPSSSQGIGLQIMRHRTSVIGGELNIISKPGEGVSVICTLPATN